MERGWRLHGHQRHHLQQVVLDHVAQRARAVVVVGAPLKGERLVPDDLDLLDVLPVPDRLEDAVGEAQAEHVLDRLLLEEVVDAVDRALRRRLCEQVVERLGRGEVVAERLLDDDRAVLGQSRDHDGADRRGEDLRRQRQVDDGRALAGVQGRGDRAGVAGVAVHVRAELGELRRGGLGAVVAVRRDRLAHVLTEGLAVPVLAVHAHQAEVVGELSEGEQAREARQQQPPGQVAPAAEHDHPADQDARALQQALHREGDRHGGEPIPVRRSLARGRAGPPRSRVTRHEAPDPR